jgi:hypothetical protein
MSTTARASRLSLTTITAMRFSRSWGGVYKPLSRRLRDLLCAFVCVSWRSRPDAQRLCLPHYALTAPLASVVRPDLNG